METTVGPAMTGAGVARRRPARRRPARRHRPGAPRMGTLRAVAHRDRLRETTAARAGPRRRHPAHPAVSRPPVEATHRPGNRQVAPARDLPGVAPRAGEGNEVPVPGSGPTARAADPKTAAGTSKGLGYVSRRLLSSRIGRVPTAAAGGRGASPHPDPTRPTAQGHPL